MNHEILDVTPRCWFQGRDRKPRHSKCLASLGSLGSPTHASGPLRMGKIIKHYQFLDGLLFNTIFTQTPYTWLASLSSDNALLNRNSHLTHALGLGRSSLGAQTPSPSTCCTCCNGKLLRLRARVINSPKWMIYSHFLPHSCRSRMAPHRLAA